MPDRRIGLIGASVLLLAAAPLARQQEGRPLKAGPSARPTLAGAWALNRGETHEDVANWRRPVGSNSWQLRPGGYLTPVPVNGTSDPFAIVRPPGPGDPIGSPGDEPETILRDLLEPAERLIVELGAKDVTMTDDIGRTIRYATNGDQETHRLAATEFRVTTLWSGVSLTQEITAAGGFKMSQIFLPGEGGEALVLAIRVEKPKLTPPVKDIERRYTRIHPPQDQTPGVVK